MIQENVKAALAGDESAWNVLYRQYYPELYAIALGICNDVAVARDMVQDAFITAYLKLSQLKDTALFGGWIKKILTHTCYRQLQRNRTIKYLGLPRENENWWEDEFSRKLDWLSTQSNLYATLAQLPEVLRSTLLLRYFSAFQSYEEIAAILCVPVGTVRSRLNQAKIKLAQQWRQHDDACLKIFKECGEWNGFYNAHFSGMHHHDDCKNRFINHLQKDVQTILPGGKINNSNRLFEKIIVDDRKFGSWLTPVNVMSSGNISIVEAKHSNSPEYPLHCPAASVIVLYRHNGKVSKITLQAFSQKKIPI